MAMSKAQFRQRWDSNPEGGGITYDDIADCAIAWGITSNPRRQPVDEVARQVVAASGAKDPYEG